MGNGEYLLCFSHNQHYNFMFFSRQSIVFAVIPGELLNTDILKEERGIKK